MTRKFLFVILFVGAVLAVSCVDPYNPPEIQSSENFLVVDALVDLGSDDSRVLLTRSQALSEEGEPVPEINAEVTIEITGGPSFTLPEVTPGAYSAAGLAVSPGDRCRLRIRTTSGEEFLSDEVPNLQPPPIDSVTWTALPGQLDIEVNTHDAEGSTKYYRWKYVQTVMYQSTHSSSVVWDEGAQVVRSRNLDEKIFTCWKTAPSTKIDVFSTNGLAEDIVSKHILVSFPSTAWELRLKYSINVYQFAIGEEEFNFWSQLRRNTESIGTIFDPQPSQVDGNIHSISSPGENALGYFSIGSAVEKRIFISREDLPYRYGDYDTGYAGCYYFDVDTLTVSEFLAGHQNELLINAAYDGPFLIGYTTAEARCIDCRIAHKGTNVQPDFWE